MSNESQVKSVDKFEAGSILFAAARLAFAYLSLTYTLQSIWWPLFLLLWSAGSAFNWFCTNNPGNRFFGIAAMAAVIWLAAIMIGVGPHPLVGTYYSPEMGSMTFLRNGRVISNLTGPTFPGSPSFGGSTTCSGTYSVDGESINISPCSDLGKEADPQEAAIASMFIGAMDMQGSVTADKRAVIVNDVQYDKQ